MTKGTSFKGRGLWNFLNLSWFVDCWDHYSYHVWETLLLRYHWFSIPAFSRRYYLTKDVLVLVLIISTLQKMFWFKISFLMSHWDLIVRLYGLYTYCGLKPTTSLILCCSFYMIKCTYFYEDTGPESCNFTKTKVCLVNNSEIPIKKSA